MREAGILCHISSLPGGEGIGTFGKAAYKFVDLVSASGLKYWQVLPLGQTSYGDSPYQSPSAFAGNPYFIDLEMLRQDGLDFEYKRSVGGAVDYERIYIEKYEALRRAYERFKAQPNSDFDAFIQAEKEWLNDYAMYMSVKSACGMKSWDEWDKPLKRRDKTALQAYGDGCGFWQFCQYEFFKQWYALKRYANEHGVHMIGDMPIYVAFDSVDVWANPEMFLLGEDLKPTVVAGVPPDAFSATGQMWGNPIYDWERLRADDYGWWIKRIEFSLHLYDWVRIDHFRGFESYYVIPYGRDDAVIGEWRKGVGMELFKRIDSVCGAANIIAEDLGYLDDNVRNMLRDTGYPGMKVLQFAFGSGDDNAYLPNQYTENYVAYTGTHDNDTTRGWYTAQNKQIKKQIRQVTGGYARTIVWDMIDCLFRSRANLVIIPMQDFLNLPSSARMNVPSTLGCNWMWRLNRLPSRHVFEKILQHLKDSGRA